MISWEFLKIFQVFLTALWKPLVQNFSILEDKGFGAGPSDDDAVSKLLDRQFGMDEKG